jgi:hypothetical protein
VCPFELSQKNDSEREASRPDVSVDDLIQCGLELDKTLIKLHRGSWPARHPASSPRAVDLSLGDGTEQGPPIRPQRALGSAEVVRSIITPVPPHRLKMISWE